jgi:hypothetical protein
MPAVIPADQSGRLRKTAIVPMTTQSKRGKMIWGVPLHGWEDLMRYGLAVAGAAGLIVGLATWFVVQLQREEIAASARELEEYKLDAGRRIEAAKAEALRAQADVTKAQKEIAEANDRAEQARAEQERLKLQLAWRRLTKEQIETISETIRHKKMPINFHLIAPAGDPEANLYANDFARLFGGAIRQTYNPPGGISVGELPSGITWIGPKEEDLAGFKEALTRAGIPFNTDTPRILLPPPISQDWPSLIIGHKPPTF